MSPAFCSVVYKWQDVKEVFFLLLLLVLLGEFFSAPAITLADQSTLTILGDNTDLYGRQRMFGSLGWAVAMLLMGLMPARRRRRCIRSGDGVIRTLRISAAE